MGCLFCFQDTTPSLALAFPVCAYPRARVIEKALLCTAQSFSSKSYIFSIATLHAGADACNAAPGERARDRTGTFGRIHGQRQHVLMSCTVQEVPLM
jgi:hypothetical protein